MGFVHSNLIKKNGRASYDLIDVSDWLPTFYHLAGGDVTAIQDRIDGMNVWDTIAHGKESPRTEVPTNICCYELMLWSKVQLSCRKSSYL